MRDCKQMNSILILQTHFSTPKTPLLIKLKYISDTCTHNNRVKLNNVYLSYLKW